MRTTVDLDAPILRKASFHWMSRSMGARLDLGDKDAVQSALDNDR
jgi:hypothetical protein